MVVAASVVCCMSRICGTCVLSRFLTHSFVCRHVVDAADSKDAIQQSRHYRRDLVKFPFHMCKLFCCLSARCFLFSRWADVLLLFAASVGRFLQTLCGTFDTCCLDVLILASCIRFLQRKFCFAACAHLQPQWAVA